MAWVLSFFPVGDGTQSVMLWPGFSIIALLLFYIHNIPRKETQNSSPPTFRVHLVAQSLHRFICLTSASAENEPLPFHLGPYSGSYSIDCGP